MVENFKEKQDVISTSEYAKEWTENSPDSKLSNIRSILNNPKIQSIKEVQILKQEIKKRDYRSFQKIVWVPYHRCDGKIWKETVEYLNNYVYRLRWKNNTVMSVMDSIQKVGVWNTIDTLAIQKNEKEYIDKYETLNFTEYKKIFSWRDKIQQWQVWDCYLVSSIIELANAQHFDTLMRTSIQRLKWMNWDLWYQVKIPLWNPGWRKILIKDSELSVAQIRWNVWYKLLEIAYAKNRVRKNDKQWNRYYPITPQEFKKVAWWVLTEALTTFLGKKNITFSKYRIKKGPSETLPWWNKYIKQWLEKLNSWQKEEIVRFLKNYQPKIWNKFVELFSWQWESDRKLYTIWWKTLYRKHAYSLTKIEKTKEWEIKSITVLNPWNSARWDWKQYLTFSLDEFFKAFSSMSCGTINTSTFLNA